MTDFLYGVATSSHQIDGNNVHSDWWKWEQEGNTESGDQSGAACDHWRLFREDLYLAKQMGLNSYRFSIEWARLEPREGHWDREVAEWYEALLAECEKYHLCPMATLHHFTFPQWVAERGGATWSHFPVAFSQYVRRVARNFGARIPLWCTLNEPMVMAVGQYVGGFMPPATFDPPLIATAATHLLAGHVLAYDILHSQSQRRTGPWRHQPIGVGIAHNLVDFLPAHHWHPMERFATQLLRRFFNRAWLDAVTGAKQSFGVMGIIPEPSQVAIALGKKTVDFIGINYYTKAYLRWAPKTAPFITAEGFPLGVQFYLHNEQRSDLDWAIHPEGLSRMIRFVGGYGVPMYITENGIADGDDSRRGKFILRHLQVLAKEIALGANIRGYYHWSLLDNFEWTKGFAPRFGLIEVNYKDQSRKVRESAFLYQKIIEAHEGRIPPQSSLLSRFEN